MEIEMNAKVDDRLDEAYEILGDYGPVYGPGFANHGPMAVEALVRLGRGDAVPAWVDRYRQGLEPAPASVAALDDAEQVEALGRRDAYPAWLATFEVALRDAPWREVLATWLPVLAPGVFAAAGHGAIRTAHATRALEEATTAPRGAGRARGRAAWSTTWVEVPGRPGGGARSLDDALTALRSVPEPVGNGVSITSAVRGLREVPEFAVAVESYALPDDLDRAITELTRALAGIYLAGASWAPIALVHGVTTPRAVRVLLPHVPAEHRRDAVGFVWRAGAAITVAFAKGAEPARPERVTLDRDELTDAAVRSGDEHAIKLTEACLAEHALDGDPVFLAAAADVAARL
jgi:hypothetical protein